MTEQEWLTKRCPEHGITRCAACRMKVGKVSTEAATTPANTPRLTPPVLARSAAEVASVPAENIEDVLVGRTPVLSSDELDPETRQLAETVIEDARPKFTVTTPQTKVIAEAVFHPDPPFAFVDEQPASNVSKSARRLEVACQEYARAQHDVQETTQLLHTLKAKRELSWKYYQDALGEFERQTKSFSSRIEMTSEDDPKL